MAQCRTAPRKYPWATGTWEDAAEALAECDVGREAGERTAGSAFGLVCGAGGDQAHVVGDQCRLGAVVEAELGQRP